MRYRADSRMGLTRPIGIQGRRLESGALARPEAGRGRRRPWAAAAAAAAPHATQAGSRRDPSPGHRQMAGRASLSLGPVPPPGAGPAPGFGRALRRGLRRRAATCGLSVVPCRESDS